MIIVDDFVVKVWFYNFCINEKMLCDGYDFVQDMYEGQFCYFGEFYFMYFVVVIMIFVDQQMDDVMLIIVLLYDIIEDMKVSFVEVLDCFGCEIVELVDGVIKLINLQFNLI